MPCCLGRALLWSSSKWIISHMTELEIWQSMGTGRISALAKRLGFSKQYIHQESKKPNFMNDDIYLAMNKIEQYEMRTKRCIENNILRSALMTSHESELVRTKAYFSLTTWSNIYANFS